MTFLQNRKTFLFSLFLLASLFLFFIIDGVIFLYTPITPNNKSLDYIFPAGATVRELSKEFVVYGNLKRPVYFVLLAYLSGDARKLHAGEYVFEAGMRPLAVLDQVANGKVLWRNITFIEGSTFEEMMNEMNNNPLIKHDLIAVPANVLMMKLGVSKINPEGLFFPDTYKYTAGMRESQILENAYETMQAHLNQEWLHRDPSLPYANPYEALIVASIIEKEAKVAVDRPQIAGVILRRLSKNMLLQMDSTIVYALGHDFKPPVTYADLKLDSLYNTYIYKGLPPTPIAMPGLASIDAAFHPTQSNALYFVARGDGSHQFSATYREQQRAILKYQKHLTHT